jgi:hypothetical protein
MLDTQPQCATLTLYFGEILGGVLPPKFSNPPSNQKGTTMSKLTHEDLQQHMSNPARVIFQIKCFSQGYMCGVLGDTPASAAGLAKSKSISKKASRALLRKGEEVAKAKIAKIVGADYVNHLNF